MADPDLFNVILLSNWDGSDEDTSYTPEIGEAFVFAGGASLEDAIQYFANPSLYLDGDGDYVTWGDAADVAFLYNRSDRYTIECWVYRTELAETGRIMATRGPGRGILLSTTENGEITFAIYDIDGNDIPLISTALTTAEDVFAIADWYYIKVTVDPYADDGDGVAKLYVNGVLEDSTTVGTQLGYAGTGLALTFGRFADSSSGEHEVYLGPVRITKGEALEDTDVPEEMFTTTAQYNGYGSAPSPLGAPSVFGLNDFTAGASASGQQYVMIVTGSPLLRVPISSWQATVQLDNANFLQAVIPAAGPYVAEIAARQATEEFIVYKASTVGGEEFLEELARAPIEETPLYEGGYNTTLVLRGYTDASTAPATPKTRVMSDIQTQSTDAAGLTRTRCAIDWFLRPGDTATIEGDDITVAYINYYATNGQYYMDIGDR